MPPRSMKEITTALTELAYMNGDYTKTVENLKSKEDIELKVDTLKSWAEDSHIEQYEHLCEKVRELFEQQAIVNMRTRIAEADYVEKMAIERVKNTIAGTDSPKEAAQAAYYLSTVKKNNIEKMRLMQDKATDIVEDRTPESALRSLVARGIIKPVEEPT